MLSLKKYPIVTYMDMKTFVLKELNARHGELAAIARACGISRRTIGYILEGRGMNVRTLEALNAALLKRTKKRARHEPT